MKLKQAGIDMTEEITREIFDHMVNLASLELTEEEAEYLRQELNNQLGAIHELEAIPIPEGTPPASHGITYSANLTPSSRKDSFDKSSSSEKIMGQAPETYDGYIVVPEIPTTGLE